MLTPTRLPTRAAPALLHSILDAIPLAVAWKDRDLRYLGCNARFAQLAGLAAPEEIVGQTDHALRWADQAARYGDDEATIISTGTSRLDEVPAPQPDGSTRWLRISRSLLAEADGSAGGIVVTIEDITEHKQSEAQLHSEKVFSETVLDSLPGIFYMMDQTGQLKRWNASYQAFIGLPAEELPRVQVLETIAPADRERVAAGIQEVFAHQRENIEADCVSGSGKHVPFFLTGRHIVIDGEHYLLGTGIDITERKQAEAERARFQEEIIAAQEAALRELSTPLIPFSKEVVVMPLIGTVDSRRAQQVLETLLQGIAASGASVAILDITGVAVVDTQVANALVRAAQAVRLLGAQVVLTGIRPEVAQTLVGLGVDMGEIVTRGTLQNGITFALEHSRLATAAPARYNISGGH